MFNMSLKVIKIQPKDSRPEFRLYRHDGGMPVLLSVSPSEKYINTIVDDLYEGNAIVKDGKVTYDLR